MARARQPNPYAAAWPPPAHRWANRPIWRGRQRRRAPDRATSLSYATRRLQRPGRSPPTPRTTTPAGRIGWLPALFGCAAGCAAVPAACVDSPHESTWYYRLESFSLERAGRRGGFRQRVRPDIDLGIRAPQRHRAIPVRVVRRHRGLRRQRPISGRSGPVARRALSPVVRHELPRLPRRVRTADRTGGLVEGAVRCWAWQPVLGSRPPGRGHASDVPVSGYQEIWWTFYPYVGLETRNSDEPGLQFFGSVRVGFTPLNFQYATLTDPDYPRAGSVVYPRCGMTGQMELGVRYQRFSASAFVEGSRGARRPSSATPTSPPRAC